MADIIETVYVNDDEQGAPKKTPRKADPLARIVGEVKAAVKEAGAFSADSTPAHRAAHHLGRSAAWAKQHEEEGSFDSLLLAHTFDAASDPANRPALVRLAAVALAQVEKLDGGK
ncbi:hypothetical protein ACIPX0_26245 [Streptomyces sp. NPDC090075]|uniref:hypothetical protein n=1 Tax=Streptomyces sp. NPDC090075 TaxID=3365937 RepID=UPI0037F9106B